MKFIQIILIIVLITIAQSAKYDKISSQWNDTVQKQKKQNPGKNLTEIFNQWGSASLYFQKIEIFGESPVTGKNVTLVNTTVFDVPLGIVTLNEFPKSLQFYIANNINTGLFINNFDFFYKIFGSRQFLYEFVIKQGYDNSELMANTSGYWLYTTLANLTLNYSNIQKVQDLSPIYYLTSSFTSSQDVQIDPSSLMNTGYNSFCNTLLLQEQVTSGNLYVKFCGFQQFDTNLLEYVTGYSLPQQKQQDNQAEDIIKLQDSDSYLNNLVRPNNTKSNVCQQLLA